MARVSEVTNPTPTQPVTVGVGAGGLATADMVLNIGPQHPATHGVLRLRIVIDGERIVSADPVIGYMHRGAEKLFEVRDYRQIVVLVNCSPGRSTEFGKPSWLGASGTFWVSSAKPDRGPYVPVSPGTSFITSAVYS